MKQTKHTVMNYLIDEAIHPLSTTPNYKLRRNIFSNHFYFVYTFLQLIRKRGTTTTSTSVCADDHCDYGNDNRIKYFDDKHTYRLFRQL